MPQKSKLGQKHASPNAGGFVYERTLQVRSPALFNDELVAELVRNREYILEHWDHFEKFGWPKASFRGTGYMFRYLQRAYATKEAPIFQNGMPFVFDPQKPSTATKLKSGVTEIKPAGLISYADAPTMKDLEWSSVLCLELDRLRPALLSARLSTIEALIPFVVNGRPSGLFQACMSGIKGALENPEIFNVFVEADQLWTEIEGKTNVTFERIERIPDSNAAFSRLLALVELVEFALETKSFSKLRGAMAGLRVSSDEVFLNFSGRAERVKQSVADLVGMVGDVEKAHLSHRAEFAVRLGDFWRGTWSRANVSKLPGTFEFAVGAPMALPIGDADFQGIVIVSADGRAVSIDGIQIAKLPPNPAEFFQNVLRQYLLGRTSLVFESAWPSELGKTTFQSLLKDCADLRKLVSACKGTRLHVELAPELIKRKIKWMDHEVVKSGNGFALLDQRKTDDSEV